MIIRKTDIWIAVKWFIFQESKTLFTELIGHFIVLWKKPSCLFKKKIWRELFFSLPRGLLIWTKFLGSFKIWDRKRISFFKSWNTKNFQEEAEYYLQWSICYISWVYSWRDRYVFDPGNLICFFNKSRIKTIHYNFWVCYIAVSRSLFENCTIFKGLLIINIL